MSLPKESASLFSDCEAVDYARGRPVKSRYQVLIVLIAVVSIVAACAARLARGSKPNPCVIRTLVACSPGGVVPQMALAFSRDVGRMPKDVSELTQVYVDGAGAMPLGPYLKDASSLEDGWGRPLQIEWVFKPGHTPSIFRIRSAGPDGLFESSDDIVGRPIHAVFGNRATTRLCQ